MSPPISHTLLPAISDDIPTLSLISAQAFNGDAHTQLNCLTKGTDFDMGPALESWISLPPSRCVVMKAVLPNGEIAGWACWGFKGFEDVKPKFSTSTSLPSIPDQDLAHAEEIEAIRSNPSLTKIQRLNKITNVSMAHFSSLLSPPHIKHLILIAIAISPLYQTQGIGSSLITYGTRIADETGVYCWVSSSDGGFKAFEKAGFKEVGRLTLDLDEFVEEGVMNEDQDVVDVKWGEYVWRYMRREAVVKSK